MQYKTSQKVFIEKKVLIEKEVPLQDGGSFSVLAFAAWEDLSGQRHCFTTRAGGVSEDYLASLNFRRDPPDLIETEENLLEILRRTGKEFEVLKTAHHGSKYSTPEELLDIVRPDLCLISAGKNNRYGHPHAELLDRLYAAGADVRITRYGGELSVVTDGEKYYFRAYDEEEYRGETYVCR